MKISVERNLLYAYTPMDYYNPFKYKLSHPFTKPNIETTVHAGVWGAREAQAIDILTYILKLQIFKKGPLKHNPTSMSITSQLNKSQILELSTEDILPPELNVTLPELYYNRLLIIFPFLRSMSPKKLNEMFQRASQIFLTGRYGYKISEHRKTPSGKIVLSESKNFVVIHKAQNLFNINYSHSLLKYTFTFNTLLGRLFINNIAAREIEWLDAQIYALHFSSVNLYKKFVLTKRPGTVIEIFAKDIATMLNHDAKNVTNRDDGISKCLDNLATLKLLNYQRIKVYKDTCFRIVKLS